MFDCDSTDPALAQAPGLALGQAGFGGPQRKHRSFRSQKIFQENRLVMTAAALVILPKRFGHLHWAEPQLAGEKFEQQFHQPYQRDAVCPSGSPVQPFAEVKEAVEGRSVRGSGFGRPDFHQCPLRTA